MIEQNLTVVSNIQLNGLIYEMVLEGNFGAMRSGQFVELKLGGFYLRRPISVSEISANTITLAYKVVGSGTDAMTRLKAGDKINTLCELGNGFELNARKPLLVGGGIGVAPLYELAKTFVSKGIKPTMLLGFKNSSEIFYVEKFEKLGDVILTTDDGSCGYKGNTVEYLKNNKVMFDRYYACGPMVMMKYIKELSSAGDMSLEARMGCGFGVCMGCSIKTTEGYKRVCKEGPVFDAQTLIFE